MSSYLLAESGDTLNSEVSERLGWDTYSGTSALSGAGSLASAGMRMAQGRAAVSGIASLTLVGHRMALAVASLAGLGGLGGAGQRIRLGLAEIAALGELAAFAARIVHNAASITGQAVLSGIARLYWEPTTPANDAWQATDSETTIWTEQTPGASPWASQ